MFFVPVLRLHTPQNAWEESLGTKVLFDSRINWFDFNGQQLKVKLRALLEKQPSSEVIFHFTHLFWQNFTHAPERIRRRRVLPKRAKVNSIMRSPRSARAVTHVLLATSFPNLRVNLTTFWLKNAALETSLMNSYRVKSPQASVSICNRSIWVMPCGWSHLCSV